jgi:hypothetical protein
MMEHNGPFRNLWEGRMMGEKYIRIIKPFLDGIQRANTNWRTKSLEKIYNFNPLKTMIGKNETGVVRGG